MLDAKSCSRCGRRLPAGEFWPTYRYPGELSSECRDCDLDYKREWKARNPEKIAEYRTREKAKRRERMANDPEYASRERELKRIRDARRPLEKRRGSSRPPTPCRDCQGPKERKGARFCNACLASHSAPKGFGVKPCRDCGVEYQPTGTHSFYCDECRGPHRVLLNRVYDKRRRAKPEAKAQRKARHKARLASDPEYRAKYYGRMKQRNTRRRNRLLRIETQPYRPVQIYERDGWRCHLCLGRIKRTAVVPHPLAPTIDHLIPIADGGPDAPSNVRAAHFLCNARRGTGGDVQLLLLA